VSDPATANAQDAEAVEKRSNLEISADEYHECDTCHTTVDIPMDLALQLDSGLFQGGKEVKQVDLNDEWYINVYWRLKGRHAKVVCVDWCVSVKFESMGPDREFATYDVVTTDDCRRRWRLRVSARDKITVTGRDCADVYRIVVVVTARDKCHGQPVGITGFCDLNLVEFYAGHTDTDD
jgi:hypothetical protein